jgi:glycosyltransferase involved in cell wall biosynthesis
VTFEVTKVSIAMTSYNGAKFIEEQLDSLRLQTRTPDEVIIIDDGSNDGTCEIIDNYIKKWGLVGWYFNVNDKNVGWLANFHNVIRKTTGDIVFFCDQDDVWDSDKILKMTGCFESNLSITVLACRLSLIDANGKKIADNPISLPFTSNESCSLIPNNVTRKFLYSISPGCTMAVKRQMLDILSVCDTSQKIPHDSLYWKIGSILNNAYILDKALVNYRIHHNNASNPSNTVRNNVKTISIREQEIDKSRENMQNVLEVYRNLPVSYQNEKIIYEIEEIIRFCDARKTFIRKEYNDLVRYYIRYRTYYRNLRMLLGDFLCRIKAKQ